MSHHKCVGGEKENWQTFYPEVSFFVIEIFQRKEI